MSQTAESSAGDKAAAGSPAEVIDLLVVGAGPAGVAAALRARELGLVAVVIEVDDVLRRIRDYSKDKLILPNFGGGDSMEFPEGGTWIEQLAFEPIDKDDMCVRWKAICHDAEVPIRLATELVGLDDLPPQAGARPAGLPIRSARIYDHRQRREGVYRVQHVALALGRGVPRRFDIPGETASIPLRLDDPSTYVGAPACVIGGGTSAAEAVIAISIAKASAGDRSPVVWSYRGDRLPRVSKALAEVFFEAYAGNGNIHYRPLSEPLMVMAGDDRRQHLALRVDRRVIDGRPVETTVLEFPTEACIACIGEDLPEAFLASLGIPMVQAGGSGRKRMLVNPFLESRRPGVYLIGDILSQAYLETDDFEADSSTFRTIRHRGNIKSALADGVRVAEVVALRLSGVADADIHLDERSPASTPAPASEKPEAEMRSPSAIETLTGMIPIIAKDSAVQAASGIRAAISTPPEGAWLMRLLPGGVESEEKTLDPSRPSTLGRRGCDLSFPEDVLLSETHASVSVADGGAILQDEGSENGVFFQLPSRRKVELLHGDLLRAGRQFLMVEFAEGTYFLAHYRTDGSPAGRFTLKPGSMAIGRRADITLDTDDGTLSRRQLAVTVEAGRLLAKDLLSANGTFVRVNGSRHLEHGDRFLIGQQRFIFSTRRDAIFEADGPAAPSRPIPRAAVDAAIAQEAAKAAGGPSPAASSSSEPSITFQPEGKTCPVLPGQTILDVAEAEGLAVVAECRAGICGSDPVRLVSGREHLDSAPSDGEAETLEDLCGLEAGPCRLACMAKVKGPVVVEILSR